MKIGEVASYNLKVPIEELRSAFPRHVVVRASESAVRVAKRAHAREADLIIVEGGKSHGVVDTRVLLRKARSRYGEVSVPDLPDAVKLISRDRGRLKAGKVAWLAELGVTVFNCPGPPPHRITDARCPIHDF